MHRLLLSLTAFLLACTAAFAQTHATDTAPATTDAVAQARRLEQLERRLKELLADITAARQSSAGSATNASSSPTTTAAGDESTPDAGAPPASLAALEEHLAAVEQQVRILERKLEIEKENAEARAPTQTTPLAGADGFRLRSGDESFLLRLRGLVQTDGLFFANDDGNLATDAFLLRRVRPTVDATLFRIFDVRLMPDFGGGTAVLFDAYVDARFSKAASLRIGKFKPPVGLERLVSASELMFVERGLPTGLVPNRDVGAMMQGDLAKARVSYQVGVFNGVVDGGMGDADDRDGKDFAARVFVHPFRTQTGSRLQGLGLGVAITQGLQNGTAASPNLPSFRLPGRQAYFRYRSDATPAGTTVADGRHDRWSPQGYFYAGRLGVLAEYVQSAQRLRRGTETATSNSDAWQLAGTWVLTGEASTYRGVTPKKAFDAAHGAWGAVEIAARVGVLEFDPDMFPFYANPDVSVRAVRTWTLGGNWYLNRNVKIAVDYEETRFDGGAIGGGNRGVEHSLFTRFQLAF